VVASELSPIAALLQSVTKNKKSVIFNLQSRSNLVASGVGKSFCDKNHNLEEAMPEMKQTN